MADRRMKTANRNEERAQKKRESRPSPSPSLYLLRGLQLIVDLCVLSLAFWSAFMLRFEFAPSFQQLKLTFFTWPYVMVLEVAALSLFGVTNVVWRYVTIRDATRIVTALGAATVLLLVLRIGLAPVGGYARFVMIPIGVIGMNLALSFLGVAGVRVMRRVIAERDERSKREWRGEAKRLLLIGAGRAGVAVAREITQHPELGMTVVGFADDDPMKIGTVIQGHKVLGDTASLGSVARKASADEAIISIASASGGAIRRIVDTCEAVPIPVRIIPGVHEILEGRVNLTRIREVTIEDLLGREAVELDRDSIGVFLTGKRVLVTGAGGSIGSELCRQVCAYGLEMLVLVEQAENALFQIHQELLRDRPSVALVPSITDICDSTRIETVFARYKPHVVFHAAAHKHVPMMEWNPGEAVKNNVFGTKKVADAAHRHGAESFVMVSTDKAVNPTSIMGATKRVAEVYAQALSARSGTRFVAVRFGNVLGSAGSVIPIFKAQIERGGPITVTHPDMRRYFMTIPEACQLVMQAAAMGNGGEIFVLDMGEPVLIADLARDLIRLSGFGEDEISIEFSGVRPGEKLFEELSTKVEDMGKTKHPKIFVGRIEPKTYEEVVNGLDEISRVTDVEGREEVRAAIRALVDELKAPDEEIPLPNSSGGSTRTDIALRRHESAKRRPP